MPYATRFRAPLLAAAGLCLTIAAQAKDPASAAGPSSPLPAQEVAKPSEAPGSAMVPGPAAVQTDLMAPRLPPVLTYLRDMKVKLTYLGNDGGLAAYIGQSTPPGLSRIGSDGKPVQTFYQIFYVTPDGNHMVLGLLFDAKGVNITDQQIDLMKRRYQALASGKTPVPLPLPALAEAPVKVPVSPAPPIASIKAPAPHARAVEKSNPKGGVSTVHVLGPVVPAVSRPIPPAAAAEVKPAVAESSLHLPDGAVTPGVSEKAFLAAFQSAVWFPVGTKTAPEVFMVVDPQCPYCHKAWETLKPLVAAGKVTLNVVMIAGLEGSEPYAVSILSQPQPGLAWYNGQGSTNDTSAIRPPPPATSKAYQNASGFLRANRAFIDRLHITGTPFLAYMGKDKAWHAAQGPADVSAFLADLPAQRVSLTN